MQILTLKKWLSFFKSSDIDIDFFINNAIVRSTYDYKLKTLFAKQKITQTDVENLYTVIVINKISYLTDFYNNNLKFDENLTIDDIPLSLNNNKIRNLKI